MLIAAIVMPSLFDLMRYTPEGISSAAAPAAAGVTLAIGVLLTLRAPQSWQQWSPRIVITVGWTIAASFGMYDFHDVAGATWVGIPSIEGWHRFGFDFRKGLLGYAARVYGCKRRIYNHCDQQRRRHSTGISAPTARHRLPCVQGAINGEAICGLLSV